MKRSLVIITILAINLSLISSAFARLNITILNERAGYYSNNFCEEEDTVYFSVDGFHSDECPCRRAEVYLVRSGTLISRERVDEGETGSFDLGRLGGRMQLQAWCTCGSQTGFKTFYRDTRAPTFTEVCVGSGARNWAHNPVRVDLHGFWDDGLWGFWEYETESWLDGAYRGISRGEGALLYGVDEGRHTVQIRVEDKCGHRSPRSESVEFYVDNRAPSVYFIDPEEDETINRNEYLTVQIAAGDPGFDFDKVSGISSVELYLDSLFSKFGEGQYLGRFPGPWITSFSTRSSLTVRASWSFGPHKLIVVAKDVAGNSITIERPIYVAFYLPYIPLPFTPYGW